jgi:hypothetical protein
MGVYDHNDCPYPLQAMLVRYHLPESMLHTALLYYDETAPPPLPEWFAQYNDLCCFKNDRLGDSCLKFDSNGSSGQLLQLTCEIAYLGFSLALIKVITAQVVIGLSVGQNMPGTHQHGACNSDKGSFLTSSCGQPMISGVQEGVLGSDC